jgi:hypothetical protein
MQLRTFGYYDAISCFQMYYLDLANDILDDKKNASSLANYMNDITEHFYNIHDKLKMQERGEEKGLHHLFFLDDPDRFVYFVGNSSNTVTVRTENQKASDLFQKLKEKARKSCFVIEAPRIGPYGLDHLRITSVQLRVLRRCL